LKSVKLAHDAWLFYRKNSDGTYSWVLELGATAHVAHSARIYYSSGIVTAADPDTAPRTKAELLLRARRVLAGLLKLENIK
jgi:hypothetical protein